MREVYFVPNENPMGKKLDEILKYPHVDSRDVSYAQALEILGEQNIPRKKRQAKKKFMEIADEELAAAEEHF